MSSQEGGGVHTPFTLPLDPPLITNQQTFLQHKKNPFKPFVLNIQHFFLSLTFRTGAFSSAMRISWILSTKWNQGIIRCYRTSRNKILMIQPGKWRCLQELFITKFKSQFKQGFKGGRNRSWQLTRVVSRRASTVLLRQSKIMAF